MKAAAVLAVERELGSLAVEDLPRWEVLELAKGIRDRVFAPARAAERARKAEEDRRFQETIQRATRELDTSRRKEELVQHGLAYLGRELTRAQLAGDLDPAGYLTLHQAVASKLEGKIVGTEDEGAVEDLVDRALDRLEREQPE